VPNHPEWGLTYDNIIATGQIPVLAKGSGGIVTTAADMDKWMTALRTGKVISMKSYREMTTGYSLVPGTEFGYGYGLQSSIRDGWGHDGGNLRYTARIYFSNNYDLNFYIVTNKTPESMQSFTNRVTTIFLNKLFQALDGAAHENDKFIDMTNPSREISGWDFCHFRLKEDVCCFYTGKHAVVYPFKAVRYAASPNTWDGQKVCKERYAPPPANQDKGIVQHRKSAFPARNFVYVRQW
jgi:hypothetical protein